MYRYVAIVLGTVLALAVLAAGSARADEFVGPFPSWANVKSDYGAVGDGKVDDTAAIQKGLEDLRRADSEKKVLYFPAGTYRITSTLMLEKMGIEPMGTSILGEDPEKTTILWDGPAGQNMFHYNAWYASLGRLTFDGAGRAKTAIEHGDRFVTANDFTDVIIKDVQFGIEAGIEAGIAETAVLRCRFLRCAKIAISIQSFNSLDWYIWDSWFEVCGIGVSNERRAGNFHVRSSVFLRSKEADLTIKHTGYFSFADNISIGSKAFFHAKRADNWAITETWGSQATLQNNLILDPLDAIPIHIENNGPNLLLDNTIRVEGNGPVVLNEPPAGVSDLISVGNRWTVEKALQVKGRLTTLDDTVVEPDAIKDVQAEPVPFLPRANRPVIEVESGADADAIQAAINQAAGMNGQRPVVHLPSGSYSIANTLVIPAGCDLQLVGDGPVHATMLSGSTNPLIRVQGPTHATFRNFVIDAGSDRVAIQVENCDQEGGRIFGEELNAGGEEYGFVSDGLKNARVELRDAGHNGLQVIGAGPRTQTWVALFCGASSQGSDYKEGIHLYDVQQEGRLLVRDIWFEGYAWSLLNLQGSGEFAYHSAIVATGPRPGESALQEWEARRKEGGSLQIDGFRGKVAITLVISYGADVLVKPPSSDLQFYLLGFVTNRKVALAAEEAKGQAVAEHLRFTRTDQTGSDALDDIGMASDIFIREMLRPLREVTPQPLTLLEDTVTDLRFYRVWANGKNGVRLQAAGE